MTDHLTTETTDAEVGCPHNSWGVIVQCPVCGTPRAVSPRDYNALPAQEPLDVEDVSRVLNQHESDCSYFEGGDFTCSCGYDDAAERVSQWLDRQDALRQGAPR